MMMKIRNGFVSNSSSSSFIIVGEDNLNKLKPRFEYVELEGEQREVILNNNDIKVDKDVAVYLTEYIDDCNDGFNDIVDLMEKVDGIIFDYDSGAFCGPYNIDNYHSVKQSDFVWIKSVDYVVDSRAKDKLDAIKAILTDGFELFADEYTDEIYLINEDKNIKEKIIMEGVDDE
jgi:hypothetical protein